MPDLIAFLRARLDEDERAAMGAGVYSKTWRFDDSIPNPAIVTGGEHWVSDLGSGVWECDDPDDDCSETRLEHAFEALHIVRWDPARVLAEVEAKRVILSAHSPGLDDATLCNICGCLDCYRVPFPCPTLLALAQPFAEHPDFRAEWRS